MTLLHPDAILSNEFCRVPKFKILSFLYTTIRQQSIRAKTFMIYDLLGERKGEGED